MSLALNQDALLTCPPLSSRTLLTGPDCTPVRRERAGGGAVQTPLTDALFCPQIMSVLLFIEHSVEVAHGKAACKFSRTGYLRIGRSRGQAGEQEGEGTGPWLGAG